MDKVEMSAKTLEEAVELALKELDAERAEVAIEVVSQGRPGFFGIGGEDARVRVTRLSPTESLASQAIEAVNTVLSHLEVSAVATVRSSGDAEIGPTIDIDGEDSGLLIGKRGETLNAFQFLVNLVLNQKSRGHLPVIIDVEQYKERRSQALQTLASRVAERVVSSGRSVTLEPMSASERRIIHMALANHPYVTTESTGEGQGRKITVRLGKGQR
ncbi:MAG: RNA-binding cell elongation regulator Jag/EloR [Dehalococcoidia bacterium]|nr:RNA-binding cell elongation regulator Jag/EloR [Dehalococcoidia bacterium]